MLTPTAEIPVPKRRWIWGTFAIYALLLILSYWTRARHKPVPVPEDVKSVEVAAVAGDILLESRVRLAYREYVAERSPLAAGPSMLTLSPKLRESPP